MARKVIMFMIAFLAVCGLLFTVSCAGKKAKPETGGPSEEAVERSQMTPEQLEEEAIRMEKQKAREAFGSENINFDFDQSVLTPKARAILERKAAWLRDNPEASVIIEGHCDERGTVEYNIALGERRARGAMDFLADLGVSASRLSTISYGEERPLDPGHNEAAWARNRRACFVIR